jgi:hypothetical protein
MEKEKFLEKWGYQPATGLEGAMIDVKAQLEKDLDDLELTDQVLEKMALLHYPEIGHRVYQIYIADLKEKRDKSLILSRQTNRNL